MPSYQIIISVQGETAGSPGESLDYTYSLIDGADKRVTFELYEDTDVTQWQWSLLSQPRGATVTLQNATSSQCYIDAEQDKSGTYLLQCITNNGEGESEIQGVAFRTENRNFRKPAPGESIQYVAGWGWSDAMDEIIDAVDNLSSGGVGVEVSYDITGSGGVADTIVTATDVGCNWMYVIRFGGNIRTGTIRASLDQSVPTVTYDETQVEEIGDTSDITFSVSYSSGSLKLDAANAGSDTYNMKMLRFSMSLS